MNNKNVIKHLNQMWQKTEDKQEREILERSILAVRAYRDCKNCSHRVVVSKYGFCSLGDCDFEPRSDEQKEATA